MVRYVREYDNPLEYDESFAYNCSFGFRFYKQDIGPELLGGGISAHDYYSMDQKICNLVFLIFPKIVLLFTSLSCL